MYPACPSLRKASENIIHLGINDDLAEFSFVIMTDPQLGIQESFVEKLPEPLHWDKELASVKLCVLLINQLAPKPKFVIICGDQVHSKPGSMPYHKQLTDLLSELSHVDAEIPILVVPGNHDVCESPTEDNLRAYREVWGDDYYSFNVGKQKFLVFNSQYMWDGSKCQKNTSQFNKWLDNTISDAGAPPPIVFQHIPFFEKHADEADSYFNVPRHLRHSLLSRLYAAGVRHIFTGHLHRNAITSWQPEAGDPMELVTTTATSVQLGEDQPGLRLVRVRNDGSVRHVFWTLEALQAALEQGTQPWAKLTD